MRTKAITNKRAIARAYDRQREKHQKKLYDLCVLYAYDVRLIYGNGRKKFVKLHDQAWRDYCFKNHHNNSMVDLNPDSFMKWVNDKKKVAGFQKMLKIYFKPNGLNKLKSLLSKY